LYDIAGPNPVTFSQTHLVENLVQPHGIRRNYVN